MMMVDATFGVVTQAMGMAGQDVRDSQRKIYVGVVVSNKMDKTIVVLSERKVAHPLYKKVVRRSKKIKAHDELNECKIGDKVEIMETRPISKDKHFRLVRIIERVK